MVEVNTFPESVIGVLRSIRACAYITLGPLDYIYKLMNGKGDYPPLWLRSHVGSSLKDFEHGGGEYVAYLKLLCGLKYNSKVLDIGCGCGLIPLHLKDYLGAEGEYIGTDIDTSSIKWCQKVIGSKYSNFHFIHIRNGKPPDLPKGFFDVVIIRSVFTHLLQEEVIDYLGEVKSLLKPEGTCLATFFLLNKGGVLREGHYKFKYREGNVAYIRKTRLRLGVAYTERYIKRLLESFGFCYEIKPGTWDGTPNGLSLQDIVLMRPEGNQEK